jgi:hypothetical protein
MDDYVANLRSWLPAGVVRVGGKPELHGSFVPFVGTPKELSKTCSASEQQWKDPGRQRIQRSQMPDLAGSGESPNAIHNIVRRPAGRLVDNKCSVQSLLTSSR